MKIKSVISLIIILILFQPCSSQSGWRRIANLPKGRDRAVAFNIGNYGYVGTGSSGRYEKDFWKYDPQSNTWERVADMPALGRIGAFAFAIENKGYVGGGVNETASPDWGFYEYDPEKDEWTRKTDIPTPGAIETSTSFSIGSKGYYLSTFHADNFFEYDPERDTWLTKTKFPGVGKMDQVGFSIGSKGYIGTGFAGSANGGTSAEFWEYDPGTDTWTKKANFQGSPRTQAVGFGTGSKGYLGLGCTRGESFYDFWEYDPGTDSWVQIEDCPYSTIDAVGMSINSKGYVGSGVTQSGGREFWEYSPSSTFSPAIEFPSFLDIYPNPAKDILYLKINEPGHLFYSIFSINGRFIKTGSLSAKHISIRELPSGIYLLKIMTTKNILAEEFIKE